MLTFDAFVLTVAAFLTAWRWLFVDAFRYGRHWTKRVCDVLAAGAIVIAWWHIMHAAGVL